MHVPSSAGPVYDQRCTAAERRLLDDVNQQIADSAPTDAEVQAIFDLAAATNAVVDAAVAETVAEQHYQTATTKALTARRRTFAIELADTARDAATAARAARRDAVQRLLQHRQDASTAGHASNCDGWHHPVTGHCGDCGCFTCSAER